MTTILLRASPGLRARLRGTVRLRLRVMWSVPLAVGLGLGVALAWGLDRLRRIDARDAEDEMRSGEAARLDAESRRLQLQELRALLALKDARNVGDRTHERRRGEFAQAHAQIGADFAASEQRLVDREASVEARGEAYEHEKKRVGALRQQVSVLRGQRDRALEVAAETTSECLHANRVERWVDEARGECERRERENRARLEVELSKRARALLNAVLRRYEGESHLERVTNTFIVEEKLFANLADASGSASRAFCEGVRCELIADESLRTLTVRADDPLAREHGRRVLRKLIKNNVRSADKVHTLTVASARTLEREVANAGARAIKVLGLNGVADEIVELVGRLKFRLSYSQNQWKHSIEVAHLTGMMACELGLNLEPARRAGLMHDIGKALTHEREGAHAVVGAQIASRCGETEEVRHAIGAHHYDETPATALAFLVIAADAMSGARPGARRDSGTQFSRHVRDIETIALQEPSVVRVEVVQGGREVRVIVAGEESGEIGDHERHYGQTPPLPDQEIHPLAQRIARAIENELSYAGQIRVTVIRESRAVAVIA